MRFSVFFRKFFINECLPLVDTPTVKDCGILGSTTKCLISKVLHSLQPHRAG